MKACSRYILKLLPTYLLILGFGLVQPKLSAADRPSREHMIPVVQRVQYGAASWYGASAQGKLMACGQRFNEHALTAAHRSLPLGTTVTVTNLRNGRSVTVRIEDRGPGVQSRVIDLSAAAAGRLDFIHRGVTPVKVQVVSLPPHHAPPHVQNHTEARLPGKTASVPTG